MGTMYPQDRLRVKYSKIAAELKIIDNIDVSMKLDKNRLINTREWLKKLLDESIKKEPNSKQRGVLKKIIALFQLLRKSKPTERDECLTSIEGEIKEYLKVA